ncbi:DNAase [Dechloromonas denitrificans]|uniref:DNAase n=1 Tax=Dechloromonas denitrificans TaxID=281362 RepID=A0A133XLN9_9RHOO|nr:TatD family hydrolase [Dechloromonas denitrificans]KXB31838.1 DNAase [Dechloromonas denitrificans]
MLVDSHCHLDFPDLVNRLSDILARMQANNVGCAVCIGVNLEDYPKVLALAEAEERLFATVGVHPEYTDVEEPSEDMLVALAGHHKVIAIGETGLDYYWQKDKPGWQRARFRTHIQAAKRVGKPLVIHTRESAADTLRLMQEEGADEVGGVMHCFTENWEIARQALDLGFYLSFSGIVTFKNASVVKEVAQKCPLDRILVETDSPYLAPTPYRGKPNEPSYVLHVAEEIARLRSLSLEDVSLATTDNFFRLFKQASRPSKS